MSSNAPAWEQKLRAIVKYYAVCQQEGDTKKFLDRYPVTKANENVDPEMRDKLKQIGGESIAEHKDGADEIHSLTEDLKDDPNPDKPQWKERMSQPEARRAEAQV